MSWDPCQSRRSGWYLIWPESGQKQKQEERKHFRSIFRQTECFQYQAVLARSSYQWGLGWQHVCEARQCVYLRTDCLGVLICIYLDSLGASGGNYGSGADNASLSQPPLGILTDYFFEVKEPSQVQEKPWSPIWGKVCYHLNWLGMTCYIPRFMVVHGIYGILCWLTDSKCSLIQYVY